MSETIIVELRELRNSIGISAKTASDIVGVPLRTYMRYETDNSYGNVIKRDAMIAILNSNYEITEDKGLLDLDRIKSITNSVLSEYDGNINFCYLFGSYAKGYATESSDVDLCISTNLSGLKFVGLIEKLRVALHKNVDLIRLSDLNDNIELLEEIMKDGIKIYG